MQTPALKSRDEVLVHSSRIAVPYTWSAGVVGTRFLKTLKLERKFMASRCPLCRKVWLPAVKACGRCLVECPEWVEVGPKATLLSYTQPHYESPAHPVPRPAYGLVRLDGADSGLLVLLQEPTLECLETGTRLEPVFLETESFGLADFLRFKVCA